MLDSVVPRCTATFYRIGSTGYGCAGGAGDAANAAATIAAHRSTPLRRVATCVTTSPVTPNLVTPGLVTLSPAACREQTAPRRQPAGATDPAPATSAACTRSPCGWPRI